jgi:hypothetical protein
MLVRRCLGCTSLVLAAVAGCSFNPPAAVDATASTLPTVAFADPGVMSDENSGTLSIPVALSAVADQPVTVNYAVTGGSAKPGMDFTVGGQTVTFGVGDTTASIAIDILPDGDMTELNETIILELSSPSGAELGAQIAYTVTISDHILPRVTFNTLATTGVESAQSVLVASLDKPSEGVSTVHVKLGGTASAIEDYAIVDEATVTFQNGEQVAMIAIGEVDDALDEDDETITFELVNPSANLLVGAASQSSRTLTDNDNEPTVEFTLATSTVAEDVVGGAATVEVRLSVPSGRAVTVNFDRASSSTALSPEDATVVGAPGTITFPKGQVSRTVGVTLVNDAFDEDNELVNLTLAGATNAQLGRAAHGLTITDDDATPDIRFMVATSQVMEASTDVAIAVVLTAASGRTVTAPFSVVSLGSSANDPLDYTVTTESPLTFAAGVTMQTITVNIKNDTLDEANESAIFTLGTVVNANKVAPLTHTLTITDDNDAASVVQFDSQQANGSANEGDSGTTPFTYDLVLDKASGLTVDVKIDFSGDADAGDFTAVPAVAAGSITISFAPGQTRKTITLNIIGDTADEPGLEDTIIMSIDPTVTNGTVGAVDERRHTILEEPGD